MVRISTLAVVVCGLVLAGTIQAADPPVTGKSIGNVTVATTYRVSKLTGMTVKNMQGEKLGTIDDLVVNLENGKVEYAALSHGGILGIGDKLFAVPYNELKYNHGREGEQCFVLNISKDKLAAAPGFDKDKWPDFANRQWKDQVDQYYRASDAPRNPPPSAPNPNNPTPRS